MPACGTFAGDDWFFLGFNDGWIRWWDTSTFALTTIWPRGAVRLPGSRPVSTLTVSPHGSFLVALSCEDASVPVLVRTDNFKTHRLSSDVCSTSYTFLHGHTGKVNAVCISPCERYVATASKDTTVRLWSARNGSLIWTFVDHDAAVTHLLFSPDGRTLVSGDSGGEICIRLLSMFVRDSSLPPVSVDGH